MTTIEFIEAKIEHLKKVLNNSKSSNRVSPLDDAMRENIKNQIENYECVLKELKRLKKYDDVLAEERLVVKTENYIDIKEKRHQILHSSVWTCLWKLYRLEDIKEEEKNG